MIFIGHLLVDDARSRVSTEFVLINFINLIFILFNICPPSYPVLTQLLIFAWLSCLWMGFNSLVCFYVQSLDRKYFYVAQAGLVICDNVSAAWLMPGNTDMGYCTQLIQDRFNQRYLLFSLKQWLYVFFLFLVNRSNIIINNCPSFAN